jgi:hypothetical protein
LDLKRPLTLLLLSLTVAATLHGQIYLDDRDLPISAATRSQVIDRALQVFGDNYIFADKAKMAQDLVRQRVTAGAYNNITTGRALARQLSADLYEATGDKHVNILFSASPLPAPPAGPPDPAIIERMQTSDRKMNYAFKAVERLDGNVGYLRLDGFTDPVLGAATVASAMDFVRNTEILIIDLRENLGGNPAMVAHLASYFFGDQTVHLNTILWGREQRRQEFFTDPDVKGAKFGNKPVFVVTSRKTFSAGEEFAYDLQALGRSITIGETTGGGANPGGLAPINDNFAIFVPSGRAVNPVTGTNWEGTGVSPDLPVSQEAALKAAHALALLWLLQNADGLPPGQVDEIRRALHALLSELGPKVKRDADRLIESRALSRANTTNGLR